MKKKYVLTSMDGDKKLYFNNSTMRFVSTLTDECLYYEKFSILDDVKDLLPEINITNIDTTVTIDHEFCEDISTLRIEEIEYVLKNPEKFLTDDLLKLYDKLKNNDYLSIIKSIGDEISKLSARYDDREFIKPDDAHTIKLFNDSNNNHKASILDAVGMSKYISIREEHQHSNSNNCGCESCKSTDDNE